MGLIMDVHKAIPADFRFPILTRLADLGQEYLPLLEMQLVSNPPMSMLKIKDIMKSTILDEYPLMIKIFKKFCNEFLTLIHSSDFCVPYSPKATDTAYVIGFGISSFEDRSSLRFRNQHRKIEDQILVGEVRQAKMLADAHKYQDDLMRALWLDIESSDIEWKGPKPRIPPPTRIYNECEPQVVGKTNEMFSWYERPRKGLGDTVQAHFLPITDETPDAEKFPAIKKFVKEKNVAKRLTFSEIVSAADNDGIKKTTDDRRIESSPKSSSDDLLTHNEVSDTSVNKETGIPKESTPKRRSKSKTAQSLQRILHEIKLENEPLDSPPWVSTNKVTNKKKKYFGHTSPPRKSRRIREKNSEQCQVRMCHVCRRITITVLL